MKLRIEPVDSISTKGTKVYLDDVELKGVTGIALEGKVNDIWRCSIDMHVVVEGMQVDTTVIANEVRTYRKASRWELLKAMVLPRMR